MVEKEISDKYNVPTFFGKKNSCNEKTREFTPVENRAYCFYKNENTQNNNESINQEDCIDKKKFRKNKTRHSCLGNVKFINEQKNELIDFKIYQDDILFKLNSSLLIESLKDEDVISDEEVISNSQTFLIQELGKAIEYYKSKKHSK